MFLGKEGPLIHWGQSFLKPWNNIHLSYNFECTFPLFPGLLGMVATKDDLFLCLKLEDVDESSVFQLHPLPAGVFGTYLFSKVVNISSRNLKAQ